MSQLAVTSEIRLESLITKAIREGWTVQKLADEADVGLHSARGRLAEIRKNAQVQTDQALAKLGKDAVSVMGRLGARDLRQLDRVLKKDENGAHLTDKDKRELDACFRRLERLCKLFGVKFDPAMLDPGDLVHERFTQPADCDPSSLPPPSHTGRELMDQINSEEKEGVGKESPGKIEPPAPPAPGSPSVGPPRAVPGSHRDGSEDSQGSSENG